MRPETPDNTGGVASIPRNVDHADRLTASFLEFVRASTVALDETVDLSAVAWAAVAGFDRPAADLSVRAPLLLRLQGELSFGRERARHQVRARLPIRR